MPTHKSGFISVPRSEFAALKTEFQRLQELEASIEETYKSRLAPYAAELSELQKKEAERDKEIKRLELVKRVLECSGAHLDLTKAALDCIEGARGCTTPAEEFVSDILLLRTLGPLTPEHVEHQLGQFRENYTGMLNDVKTFIASNPEVAASVAVNGAPRLALQKDQP